LIIINYLERELSDKNSESIQSLKKLHRYKKQGKKVEAELRKTIIDALKKQVPTLPKKEIKQS